MSTSNNLKQTIASTTELKETFESTVSAAKNGKLQVGSVVRLIVLVISWINQIAVTFGTYSVPDLDPSVVYIIATVITIAATLYSYWANNSWTLNAKTTDAIFELMKGSGITVDEVTDAIGAIIDARKDKDAAGTEAGNDT